MKNDGKRIDPDLNDQVDCLGKSLANLRSDIPKLIQDAVRDAVFEILKERKPKPRLEVGYRG